MMREIQSLARGLKILAILADAPETVGVSSIALNLGIDKSSVSLLMQTLANYGFAEQEPSNRQYRLGPAIVQLSRSLLTKMPLREAAKPFLLNLVQETGECAHLGIHSQGKVLYIDQVESTQALRVNTEVGFMAPLHCTALGKVLLAWDVATLTGELESYTPRTQVDPKLLQLELDKTRSLGYATDDEEFTIGVRCVAAPVIDYRGKVIGALGISGPASRITTDKLPDMAEKVTAVASALSDRMSSISAD